MSPTIHLHSVTRIKHLSSVIDLSLSILTDNFSFVLVDEIQKYPKSGVYSPRPLYHRLCRLKLQATKFVNCIYSVKITQYFKKLILPLIAIFTFATRESVHNNDYGPLPKQDGGHRCSK